MVPDSAIGSRCLLFRQGFDHFDTVYYPITESDILKLKAFEQNGKAKYILDRARFVNFSTNLFSSILV